MIACILCGGVGEVMLVMAGFTWLLKWFRKRHDKRKCKCCQSHMPPVTLDDCRKKTLEELEYERGIDGPFMKDHEYFEDSIIREE